MAAYGEIGLLPTARRGTSGQCVYENAFAVVVLIRLRGNGQSGQYEDNGNISEP